MQKFTIINSGLKDFLVDAACVNKVLLPGVIVHSITKNRSKLESAYKRFLRSTQILLEATALKDKDGNFIFDDIEEDGVKKQSYTYLSKDEKERVIKELEKLNQIELGFDFFKANEKLLVEVKEITPEQMHFALILTSNFEDEVEVKDVKSKRK